MILDILHILEILTGIWAIFAIVRWDLRRDEFVTGGGMLMAILLCLSVITMRLLDTHYPWHGELLALAISCLFFSIGRFYYERRNYK